MTKAGSSKSISPRFLPSNIYYNSDRLGSRRPWIPAHLLEVDRRLPELVLRLVEVSHANFSEVTGVVFVDVSSVMMLVTSHTTTTGMLAMLAYTTVTRLRHGRDWIES